MESVLLKVLDDLALQAALQPLWLDGNERVLQVGRVPEAGSLGA